MTISTNSIAKSVKFFCAQIGADSLLVQGAGGNVSWKDENVLWVKASGTWLADAELKEIFVPVNLPLLQTALNNQDFTVEPEVTVDSDLRPSIETLLHALMPQKVVVHLHAVEILAHLVQVNAKEKIKCLVGDAVKWIYVDYSKPGADLARSVSIQLTSRSDADVVFMGNHGLVIGGNDVDDITSTLRTLISIMQTKFSKSLIATSPSRYESDFLARNYVAFEDKEVSQIANNEELMRRLRQEWALYPDHVVFLGAEPAILEINFKFSDLEKIAGDDPPFIFACGNGVYQKVNATAAQISQLRCYYDVIIRQSSTNRLVSLSGQQVSELLDWDAEKFRQSLIDEKLSVV
jgi:rhamnose utilization protein RhaD (predicted bifunctional aldolase and dehydrogenase)